jgi:hypothetical protein
MRGSQRDERCSGYRYIRKTDEAPAAYLIDEAEARVVRRIFEMYTVEGLRGTRCYQPTIKFLLDQTSRSTLRAGVRGWLWCWIAPKAGGSSHTSAQLTSFCFNWVRIPQWLDKW